MKRRDIATSREKRGKKEQLGAIIDILGKKAKTES